jgi:hypothetical protein
MSFFAAMAGAPTGAAIGAIVADATDVNERLGVAVGGALGGYAAGTAVRSHFLARVREASRKAEGVGIDEEEAKSRLRNIAQRSPWWRGSKGFLTSFSPGSSTGAYERGQTQQLISELTKNPEVAGGLAAGWEGGLRLGATVPGVGIIPGLGSVGTGTYQGAVYPGEAEETLQKLDRTADK